MKILVFDTETGGVNAEENDILQLSYQVVECETRKVAKEVNHYFPWPEDKWRVEPGAIAVNGLTEEFLATQELSDRYKALEGFFEDMHECALLVAHNGSFDKKFIIAEAQRVGYVIGPDEWKQIIDTMKTTTDLCKLPPHPGRSGYKWPKLIELANFLKINTEDINLHDSSADVELTKRCFMHLLDEGFYSI